jgi:hypothetical protein
MQRQEPAGKQTGGPAGPKKIDQRQSSALRGAPHFNGHCRSRKAIGDP